MSKISEKIFQKAFGKVFGDDLIMEDNWSDDIKTKWKPKPGTFEGSANEIASAVIANHKDLKSAIGSIEFYKNRGGDKLSDERISVLNKAADIVRKHYGEKE